MAHESRSRSPLRSDQALVLLIEDERPQQMALMAALESRGYRVQLAASASQAVKLVRLGEPDLVILDLGLPDIDGIELCRHLRTMLRCPIIVVTGDALESRTVEALDAGADDYVIKPFSARVLLARIRVALRHFAATAAIVEERLLRCGDVTIDVAAHQATVGGEAIDLQARQFSLLTILMRNQGKVVTYAALARALGGLESRDVDPNGLRVLVSKLRKQLGSGDARPTIATELHVGYRLTPPDVEQFPG